MENLFIKGGRVVDPRQGLDKITNIRISEGKIDGIDVLPQPGDRVLNAQGKIVAPGLIDMHVHLREPGREEDETIETGTRAAVKGGFTSIVCCPNTEPPLDTPGTLELVRQLAKRANQCNVYAMCCISKNREGKELAELGMLFESGAVACSDDGSPVSDPELMRRAFEYCRMFDKPILNHPESLALTKGGVMHEGKVSMMLGLRGMPAAAEDVMVARDTTLAELTGGRLHVMHVSTEGAVQGVKRAKERGVKVTAEVTPHHIALTDEALQTFDSNFKMNPPLRSRQHLEACLEGLRDGTIDVIATDHAPHAVEKKMQAIDHAPFGIIGLETAIPIVVTKLVKTGILSWPQMIEKMSTNPAKILGLPKGSLTVGSDADVTVIDPEKTWVFSQEEIRSKSKNSPFLGMTLTGCAAIVIVGGEVKYTT
ncbi:MAG: dihydroorotase [Planctomycetaceae bacterium]|jgi:dihydroorotase|nr:dihydroorotase [Planctomycetaceae bacterium]